MFGMDFTHISRDTADMSVVGLVVLALLLCGFIAGAMAQNRGNAFLPYFALGCLFGVFGILIAAVARPPLPMPDRTAAASPRQAREPRTWAERRVAHRFSDDQAT